MRGVLADFLEGWRWDLDPELCKIMDDGVGEQGRRPVCTLWPNYYTMVGVSLGGSGIMKGLESTD